MSSDKQPPPSPYGPASGEQSDLERAFGEHAGAADTTDATDVRDPEAAPTVSLSATDDVAWVDRGRRVLRRAALIGGSLSLALTALLVVQAMLSGSVLSSSLPSVVDDIVWILTLACPVLAVIALNLVIWRALLRPIARLSRGAAIALIIGVVLVLAVVSVVAVFALLLGGFLASTALTW